MHNGPHIAEATLADREDPFGWRDKPDVTLDYAEIGKNFACSVAGWSIRQPRSEKARCERTFLLVADKFWVVRDKVLSEVALGVRWRFISPKRGRRQEKHLVLEGERYKLLIMPFASDERGVIFDVEETSYSDDYLSEREACGLVYRSETANEHEVVWLMILFEREVRIPESAHFFADAGTVRLNWLDSGSEHQLFFGPARAETAHGVSSDARLTYLELRENEIERLIVCGGSEVSYGSEKALQCQSVASYVDLSRDGTRYFVDSVEDAGIMFPPTDKQIRME